MGESARVNDVAVDQSDWTKWMEQRAMARMLYVPPPVQVWESLKVPTGSQLERVPSPQSKRYCTV